jgi:hypothetical protein
MLVALIITIAAVRVRRADLAGAQTTPGTQPRTKRAPGREIRPGRAPRLMT